MAWPVIQVRITGSVTSMAALYLALSWPTSAALPFGNLVGSLDSTRSRWCLAAFANAATERWQATYADEIALAYPELTRAARSAYSAFRTAPQT